jgi:hypothetical protein
MVTSAASVRAGVHEIKQIKDADPKACGRKSRVEDADMRRYRAPSARAVVAEGTI